MSKQREFLFGVSQETQGYDNWLARRRAAQEELARKLNLPLGREAEVWLRGGVRLRGKLRLKEEFLLVEEERLHHLELVVDSVPFTSADIESCVRLD